MQPNVSREQHEDETKRETPSGKWIVAVDRAQTLIHLAIARLEAHAELADVGRAIEDLRRAAALTGGAQ